MASYHETATANDTPRKLGPYEFIATPPPALVLQAIIDSCGVGGTIAPGVRQLAELSGVSRGLISDCLYQLAADGYILYDGRNITRLYDPDAEPDSDRSPDRSLCDESNDVIDLVIDRSEGDEPSDRSGDRSPLLAAMHRVQTRWNENPQSDRSPDRSAAHMVDSCLTTTSPVVVHESSTTGGSGGNVPADRSPDRSHPAAQIMAELGAESAIIADAFRARPDWTAQQVRDRWDYDQKRIAASAGKLNEGVFFHALRCGQLAPSRQAPQLDPAAYAADELYQLASSPPPPADDLRARAEAITPPTISGADFLFVMQRLAIGNSDEQALQALADRRRRRGAP